MYYYFLQARRIAQNPQGSLTPCLYVQKIDDSWYTLQRETVRPLKCFYVLPLRLTGIMKACKYRMSIVIGKYRFVENLAR